jgi:hypothetical protein
MEEIMKIGDIVQSPKGLIKITKFNKNGICLFDKLYPDVSSTGADCSKTVRTYPIVDRPKAAPPKRTPLYGKGVIGEGRFRSVENSVPTAAYRAWRGMLQRVYSPQDAATAETYGNVEVCPEWLNFQNYAAWYYQQMNGRPPVSFKWVVDKDLLVPMNRLYGPTTCALIPQPVNSVMTFRRASKRGQHITLPLGVSHGRPDHAEFAAYGSRFDTGLQFLGFYPTVRQAQAAYWEFKFRAIHDTAIWFWNYLPEPIAMRMLTFSFDDVRAYYGDDPYIWGTHGHSLAINKHVVIQPPSRHPIHIWEIENGRHVGYWVYPDGRRVRANVGSE